VRRLLKIFQMRRDIADGVKDQSELQTFGDLRIEQTAAAKRGGRFASCPFFAGAYCHLLASEAAT